METFLYFAYGSNMLSERLVARCPSATPVGVAYAPNHMLKFSKLGIDTSGKATLVSQSDTHQYGVLFKISKNEIGALDAAESAGTGYQRDNAFPVVQSKNNANIYVTTYLAIKPRNNLKPFDWYLALVLAGAKQHNLPAKQISALQQVSYNTDTKTNRKERLDALAALGK